MVARKLEELRIEEERKREEEIARKKYIEMTKRLEEIHQKLAEKKKEEDSNRRKKLLMDHLCYRETRTNSPIYQSSPMLGPNSSNFPGPLIRTFNNSDNTSLPPLSKPWNSRDYVESSLRLSLEDLYSQTPVSTLAEVYRKLNLEKGRLKEIIRNRIVEGEF